MKRKAMTFIFCAFATALLSGGAGARVEEEEWVEDARQIIAHARQSRDPRPLRNYATSYAFREGIPGMEMVLDQLITVAEDLQDGETFERLGTFTFSHPNTAKMEAQLVRAIRAAHKLEATKSINNFAIRSFAIHTFTKQHTQEMGLALAHLIFAAADLRDVRTLELLLDIIPHHRSLYMKRAGPLIMNFLRFQHQAEHWEILREASQTLLQVAEKQARRKKSCFQLIRALLTGKD